MADPVTAQSLLDQTNASIISLKTAAQDSLGNLKDVAALPFLSWFDFAATPSFDATTPAALKLTKVKDLKLANTTLSKPVAPTVMNLDTLPQLKQAILDALPPVDLSVNTDGLKSYRKYCLDMIESGGVDISAGVQAAVFNTGWERDLQTLNDELDLCGARVGSKGFRYPNSMVKAQQDNVLQKYAMQRNDQSREITKAFAAMAQKNIEMAVREGVDVEKAIVDTALRIALATLDIQKVILEKFQIQQEAYIKEFEGQLHGLLAQLEAEKVGYSAYIEFLAAVRGQLQIEQTAYTTQFDGELKAAIAQLDADKSNADLQVKVEGLLLEAYRTTVNTAVEKGKGQIQQMEAANTLRAEAIGRLAQAYVGLLTNMTVDAVSLVKG